MKNSVCLFTFLLFLLSAFIVRATNYYVNDASTSGDIYCAAVGNDNNSGTTSLPFRTLKKALTVSVAGDYIYIDKGTYIGSSSYSGGTTGGG